MLLYCCMVTVCGLSHKDNYTLTILNPKSDMLQNPELSEHQHDAM